MQSNVIKWQQEKEPVSRQLMDLLIEIDRENDRKVSFILVFFWYDNTETQK